MTKKIGKRIYRPATVEEQERHKRIREQVQEELPDIEQRARRQLAEAMQRGVTIQHTIALLKSERLKKGLSLADMKERTGIERSTLSRLENDAEANPTVDTLTKYAAAVGKKVLVVLADADEGEHEDTGDERRRSDRGTGSTPRRGHRRPGSGIGVPHSRRTAIRLRRASRSSARASSGESPVPRGPETSPNSGWRAI